MTARLGYLFIAKASDGPLPSRSSPAGGRFPARRGPVERPPSGPRSRRPRPAARWLLVAVVVLAAAAVAAVALAGGDDISDASGVTDPALIGRVQTFDVPSRTHVETPVDYPQTPPVGGDHHPVWQNCGFYDQPILNETAVHSMEHGAVWITFRPDLPGDQVDQIRALAQQDFVLASRWPDGDLPAPIVVSAWGAQLWLEALPDAAADEFVATHRQGPGAPEAGEPCTGGHAGTR
jgi:hypothetical protein